jgi:hypothetical protein
LILKKEKTMWPIDQIAARIGQSTREADYNTIVAGVPGKNQWYKMLGGDGRTITGHRYVCICGADVSLPGDIFAWESVYECNSKHRICLKSFLEAMAQGVRKEAACVAVGIPARPTALELDQSKALGKKIKVKDGPIEKEELQAAYAKLPVRQDTSSAAQNGPLVLDTWDEKNGASDGQYKYSGSNPGPDSVADLSFGDPHSHKQFGR